MRLNLSLLGLPPLLVLGGCHPSNPPNPAHPPQLSAVAVTCTPAAVVAYKTAQCSASATDQDGQPYSVPGFTWTSSNDSLARVDASGKVSASTTPGSVTVSASATADGVTQQGQASVTITAATPTVHATNLSASETWKASDNPHLVRGSLEVNAASLPTLTLEAGLVVFFEPEAELRFTQGSLKAVGTQGAPIQLLASAATAPKGSWRGLVFTTPGSASQLEYVTLSQCGALSGAGACVDVEKKAAPVLRFVSVDGSGSAGVRVADDGSAFGAGSTQLSVSNGAGYAVRIGSNQADSLPVGGTMKGNTPNAVELQGNVSRTLTWPNPGVDYFVNKSINVQGTPASTLTISAGTVLRFSGTTTLLKIGETQAGELVVDGTAAAPVLFSTQSATPAPEQWGGIRLLNNTTQKSRISHATMEYAGGIAESNGGNLLILSDSSDCNNGPVITDFLVQRSARYGVLAYGHGFGPGSARVAVHDTLGTAITLDPDCMPTLPSGLSISGNRRDVVRVDGFLHTTQTWPNLGIPYYIDGDLIIGGPLNPTLTLQSGTQFLMEASAGVRVGSIDSSGVDQPGNLIAQGTAAAPISFKRASLDTNLEWGGFHFWQASTLTKLDYVVASGAGRPNNYQKDVGTGGANVYRETGAFITHSTFSDSAGCGITRSDGSATGSTAVTTDFTLPAYGNTFTNNTGGAQCKN